MSGAILIVDDSESNRMAIEGMLAGEGYRLETACNGEQALEILSWFVPDVMLLDVMMPGMDGYEVCHTVRTTLGLAELPILMITALDDEQSRLRGLEVGADEFIQKPINKLELRARLRTLTRLNRYRALFEERARLAQAYRELQVAYDTMLKGWVMALDMRDKETEGHSLRVTDLTLALAREWGVDEKEIEHLHRGALLHDIGKIGISDSILRKPGPLTSEEWAIMKQHPQYAYDMLSFSTFLKPALEIPYCHHEKWDGTGYPRGLQGEQIPLAARLFAIVDVWDALISDRPYRSAWSKEQALAYIQNQAGKHFDPKIVPLFVNLVSKNGASGDGSK